MSLLKCTLLTVLFTVLHSAAFAQLPADQGFIIKTELDKRGLTEAEAQGALAAKGFDIEKMEESVMSQRPCILQNNEFRKQIKLFRRIRSLVVRRRV